MKTNILYLTVFLIISTLSSCLFDDPLPRIRVSVNDLENNAVLTDGVLAFTYSSGTWGYWGPAKYSRDTVEVNNGIAEFDESYYDRCIKSIYLIIDGYHVRNAKDYVCLSLDSTTKVLDYDAKPEVDFTLKVHSEKGLRYFSADVYNYSFDYESPWFPSRVVSRGKIDCESGLLFTDTTLHLKLTQSDSFNIEYSYGFERGRIKDILHNYVTDNNTEYNYTLNIE